MTPKEKALHLVEAFQFETKESELLNQIIIGDISVRFSIHMAKKSALIAVEECLGTCVESMIYYWVEVKNEIEKL